MPKFCPDCGHAVAGPSQKFCPGCGLKQNNATIKYSSNPNSDTRAPSLHPGNTRAGTTFRSDDWLNKDLVKMGNDSKETNEILQRMLGETNAVFGDVGIHVSGGLQNREQAGPTHMCPECNTRVEGRAVNALGGVYHAKCFLCSKCNRQIEDDTFTVRNNKAVCDSCVKWEKKLNPNTSGGGTRSNTNIGYTNGDATTKIQTAPRVVATRTVKRTVNQSALSPEERRRVNERKNKGKTFCAGCGHAMLENGVVRPDGAVFHEFCLICYQCGNAVESESSFVSVNGKCYHSTCYKPPTASKCGVCQGPITGKFVKTPDGTKYHKACFVCIVCKKPFIGGSFIQNGSDGPYCTMGCKQSRTSAYITSHAKSGIRFNHKNRTVFRAGDTNRRALPAYARASAAIAEPANSASTPSVPSSAVTGAKFCPDCGTPRDEGRFCSECGKSF